jgi:serine/threonine protein kinase
MKSMIKFVMDTLNILLLIGIIFLKMVRILVELKIIYSTYQIAFLAKDLIDKLLVLNPKSRYTSSQVLEHKWITENTRTDALGSTIAELKKFNARRKLRVCIQFSYPFCNYLLTLHHLHFFSLERDL